MTAEVNDERDPRPVSEREAEVYVASTCFKTGPPGRVGVEIERLVHAAADPTVPVPAPTVRAALGALATAVPAALPAGGRVTLEPGGQVELSTTCAPDLPALIAATRAELAVLDAALAAAGLVPSPVALDAHRPPVRSVDTPRYAAMQRRFDRAGAAGRTMMCSTASVQVCLDAGTDGPGPDGAEIRWRRLHALAPVLVAMFANSAVCDGRPTGSRSGRQAVWQAISPDRTRAPDTAGDPRAAWARYALDASVLVLPHGDSGPGWDAPAGLTLRGWLRGEGPRPCTRTDVDYHLSTLFPPVRPRGFLELRVVDAQPGDDWEVVAAVVTALVEDPAAADTADRACRPVAALPDPMAAAARDALTHPVLARAARCCAGAALDALPRLGADDRTRELAAGFVDRHTARGRCPADDQLDAWTRSGAAVRDRQGVLR